ncbi:MAG TPA: LD-carboxypeptidase [Candidatus Acidoferrales bacterium]|nr:LD-carboxypeptidase [Candidatus Acidoferrales bacterium]
MKLIKPRALRPGDKIGVVATAGAVDPDELRRGVEAVSARGFEVELSRGLTEKKGYLAGSEELRAQALEEFFLRPDIKAIFCARGGFGSAQLLPLLDPARLRFSAKIFVGFSDVTVLVNWLAQRGRFVTFHGPMVAMDIARGLTGRTKEFFWRTLSGEQSNWEIGPLRSVQKGLAQGELAGGCLSLLVTTLGTPYEIETKDKVLFIEDVGEKPYRIERMLTHLKMAGKFAGIRGLIFGHFAGCEGNGERELSDIIGELFERAPYPVVWGFPAGHGDENLLVPIGARVTVDGTRGVVSLVEAPVET